ncbi:hypothetical protein ACSMEV_15355 [Pseudomonas sp. MLB6B]
MKRTVVDSADTNHPLIKEAITSLRRYHEAKDAGSPAAEIERLRLIAEFSYQAVTDSQSYSHKNSSN